MAKVLYSGIDILIDEGRKSIVINPKGERFYFVECEEYNDIYTNATITQEEDGSLIIEGEQELYTLHDASGFSYEKLRCVHPESLIRKRNFLGITWYSVYGILKRQVHSRYRCQHLEYTIRERTQILSCHVQQEVA